MTMYTLPNFCRVCLKYDKNLIDLEHIENEPSETLISKLHQCVSEVEWNIFKPLMCHPCIKKLNNAYDFKKQCIQSASFLKSYMTLLQETKKNNETQNNISLGTDNNLPGQSNAYMMLPNQKYVKIVVGPQQTQNQNSFQNVFLNIVPTTSLNTNSNSDIIANNNKDSNQNVFLNINNTFQKFIPIAAQVDSSQEQKNVNVNQLLTESKSEELSVEIDPTDFDLDADEYSSENDDDCDDNEKDWDEVISHSQILTNDIKQLNTTTTISKLNGDNKYQNGNKPKYNTNNYVPILPKQSPDDFLNSGQHFLSSSDLCINKDYSCELCHKNFLNIKALKYHFKEFHLGKAPFKCEYCYRDFVIRKEYEMCVKSHKNESDALNPTITLSDLQNSSLQLNNSDNNQSGDENGDYPCEVCTRHFTTSTGLLRHKVRKHNQKNKKKYFIKGMKNARCDVCNREFSTQSYMQLHRKLHLRDDIGYKYKVFGKSVYNKSLTDNNSIKQNNVNGKIEQLSDDSDTDNDENQLSNNDNRHLLLSESSNNENIDLNKMDIDEDDRLIINEDECGDDDDDDDDDSDNKK